MRHQIRVDFKRVAFKKVAFKKVAFKTIFIFKRVGFITHYPQKNYFKHHFRTLLLLRQVLMRYRCLRKFHAKKVLFYLTYSIGRQFQNQQLFLFWLTLIRIIVGKVFCRVQLLKKYMFAGYFRLINEL